MGKSNTLFKESERSHGVFGPSTISTSLCSRLMRLYIQQYNFLRLLRYSHFTLLAPHAHYLCSTYANSHLKCFLNWHFQVPPHHANRQHPTFLNGYSPLKEFIRFPLISAGPPYTLGGFLTHFRLGDNIHHFYFARNKVPPHIETSRLKVFFPYGIHLIVMSTQTFT